MNPAKEVAFPVVPTSANVTARRCVACNGSSGPEHYFRHRSIALYRCDRCHSLVAWPRPRLSEQTALHDNPDYYEHPYFERRRGLTEAVERRCRAAFARIGKGIDLQSLRGERHLDVGCDTGSFLLAAAKLWATVPAGVDVAHRSVAEARRRGLEAYCCTLESSPESLTDFSVITAIDVVEHVVDPAMFLAEVRRRLRPGGICYLETPNAASNVYRIGRAVSRLSGGRPRWVFERLFPSEHIQYFSREGFLALADRSGLEVVSLFHRKLPFEDIGASWPVRLALSTVQMLDAFAGDRILLCMVVRRPEN
jgi:cyclopropane fatty-acyl-phospholipid synthase-like methyltransferase